MRISILTFGTRGDVQPYIALGKALQAQGHDVLVAAPDNFAAWVEEHGLEFHPLGGDIAQLLQSPELREVMAGNWLALLKILRTRLLPMMRGILDATWEAARDADVIVYHPKAGNALDVAEATGARPISAAPIPIIPTAEFPAIIASRDLGPRLNRLTHQVFRLSRAPYVRMLNRWRRETLGLGKGPMFSQTGEYSGGLATRLCAVSPTVLPRPKDWDDDAHMTGYWFLDEAPDWQPDPELAAFLDAGEPPVYIGFGSMTTKDPQGLARTVVEGVRQAGVRAILATGWGGLDEIDTPDEVFMIDKAPHEALFPRMSGVVHHGGAGTTAAGLRAGRPTLVCPLAMDQPFWAHRVWKLGCGPKPQRLRRLKVERFAQGLRELVSDEGYRARSREVAQGIASEDGVARAVEIILDSSRNGRTA